MIGAFIFAGLITRANGTHSAFPANLNAVCVTQAGTFAASAKRGGTCPVLIQLIVDVGLALIAGAFLATQVIYPLLTDRQLFPWFRRQRELEHRLTIVHQEQKDAEIEREIREAKYRMKNPTSRRKDTDVSD